MITACIFDLDGVIVDTAKYHYIAWKDMAASLDIEFTKEDNEHLKGVGRMESLDFILKLGGITKSYSECQKLAYIKNEHYKNLISNIDASEILPGVVEFLEELKSRKIRIALGSSSKNARNILSALKLTFYFDAIIDGTNTTQSKPDPQVFLLGASSLEIDPKNIIVFEDAVMGVEAAKKGGFIAVGVGEEEILTNADLVIKDFSDMTFSKILNGLSEK